MTRAILYPHKINDPGNERNALKRCREHVRKLGALTLVQVSALLVIIAAVYLQSYNGRAEVVSSNRAGCERGAGSLVSIVNALRAEGAPGDSITALDSHIDRGMWFKLKDKADQRAVFYGQYIPIPHTNRTIYVRPFRCDVAYPNTSPFVFIR